MASMGFLGAVGGGAKGLGKFLTAELEQERKLALEEMRTTNNRETNRINNEQRDSLAAARDAANNAAGTERLQLQQAGDLARDAVGRAYGNADTPTMQQNLTFLTRPVEEGGFGLTREDALTIVSPRGDQSNPDSWKQSTAATLLKTGNYEPEEVMSMVDTMATQLFPKQPPGQAAAPGGSLIAGAKTREEAAATLRQYKPDATDEQIEAKISASRPDLSVAAPAAAPPAEAPPSAQAPAPAPAAAPVEEVPSLSAMQQGMAGAYGGSGAEAVGNAASGAANLATNTVDSMTNAASTAVDTVVGGVSSAVGGVNDAMAGTTNKANSISAFLNYRRAGVPFEAMPVEVLMAYIEELEPDHPDYPKIAAVIEGSQQQQVAGI